MKYLGGKFRIGKKIAAILDTIIVNHNITDFYDPTCGSCWVEYYMKAKINRHLSDIHPDLILLWNDLKQGWIPPEKVTEEEYHTLMKTESSALRGFAGFACSWGGKFNCGYARDPKSDRNYAKEGRNSLLKKIKVLQYCSFSCQSYWDIKPENGLVYCDIPYAGTTEYSTKGFDHIKFWDWVRDKSKDNVVIVSEYTAPEDFKCIAEFPTKTDLSCGKDNHKEKRIEKLFTINNLNLSPGGV